MHFVPVGSSSPSPPSAHLTPSRSDMTADSPFYRFAHPPASAPNTAMPLEKAQPSASDTLVKSSPDAPREKRWFEDPHYPPTPDEIRINPNAQKMRKLEEDVAREAERLDEDPLLKPAEH